MVEPAGLAVGIVALIGTFKECIEVFLYFEAARSLWRDYEMLSAKMDLEKAHLLLWAQRVNLLKPDYDKRLDDPTVWDPVLMGLKTINVLLSNGEQLQQRYGVRKIENQREVDVFESLSRRHMSNFAKEFEQLNLRIDECQRVSHRLKARWAIRDKTKFGDLLSNLNYFVSKLNDLVPHSPRNSPLITRGDLRALPDMRSVLQVSEATAGHECDFANVTKDYFTEDRERRIL